MQMSDVEVDLTAEDTEAAPPKRQKVAASKSPAASTKAKAKLKAEPKAEPNGKGKASGDKRKRGRKVIDDSEEDDESFEVGTATFRCILRPSLQKPLSCGARCNAMELQGVEAQCCQSRGLSGIRIPDLE